MTRVAIVVGAGPGVSGSFARLLADDGWDIGLVGADQAVLAEVLRLTSRGEAPRSGPRLRTSPTPRPPPRR